jgi:hypothetical protein
MEVVVFIELIDEFFIWVLEMELVLLVILSLFH